MRVKHFRLETADKRYLLALVPVNFGKLTDDRSATGGSRAIDAAVPTDAHFMIAIDDDAYVEADPYGWIGKDWDLAYAHFYLRENAATVRGGTVLHAEDIRAAVAATVMRLLNERAKGATPATQSDDLPTAPPTTERRR